MHAHGRLVQQLHHPLALALVTAIANEMTDDRVPNHIVASAQNCLHGHHNSHSNGKETSVSWATWTMGHRGFHRFVTHTAINSWVISFLQIDFLNTPNMLRKATTCASLSGTVLPDDFASATASLDGVASCTHIKPNEIRTRCKVHEQKQMNQEYRYWTSQQQPKHRARARTHTHTHNHFRNGSLGPV